MRNRKQKHAVLAVVLAGFMACPLAHGRGARNPKAPPDLTKGDKPPDYINECPFVLGSTGAYSWIWSQWHSCEGATQILITKVDPKTPADGVLQKGDVILGIGQEKFKKNVRRELSAALFEAEKEENGGRLSLMVWRQGKVFTAQLTLPVIKGAYDQDKPVACEKTQQIIRLIADRIAERGLGKGGISCNLDALGLLATGEEKYLPLVREYARKVGKPDLKLSIENSGKGSWTWSYATVFLAEYYLIAKDEYVLPAITEYATKIAMGRSGVGTWSHGMAKPSENGGRLYGSACAYGAMNQCGITCTMSLVLAKKCGVKNDEVDLALRKASDFLRWYVDLGSIPYGDHTPWLKNHEGNGKCSQAAVLFNLLGEPKATRFFSQMALASSYGIVREIGHTGHFFSQVWGGPGTACAGSEALAAFTRNQQWYHQLERRGQGNCVYQSTLEHREGNKYKNWSTNGVRLLHYCQPRKKLYITGKGGRTMEPLVGKDLEAALDAGRKGVPDDCSTGDLLELLGSWSPVIRLRAAQALGSRDEDVVKQLIAMLDSKNRYARYGACLGLNYAGRKSIEAVDALIEKAQRSDDLKMRYYAVQGLRLSKSQNALGNAARKAVPVLLKLAATDDLEQDPHRKLHNEIAVVLFKGFFPGGKGIEKVDRSLLIPAVKSLLTNPNGGARSVTSTIFDDLTNEDLAQLWGDIYCATKYEAPSGVMFGGGVRYNGIKLMANHGIKEGIDVGIRIVLRETGWGDFARKGQGFPALMPYGDALKEFFPELKKVVDAWAKTRNKDRQKSAKTFAALLAKAKQTKAPKLKSIASQIEAYEKGNGKKAE